jgi:hypothetical protein
MSDNERCCSIQTPLFRELLHDDLGIAEDQK